MNSPAKKLPWTIGVGLLLLLFTLALVFLIAELKARVAQKHALPVLGTVDDFTLTNQNSQAVSLADLRGQVWVADIIFTTCPGPCLRMSRQMKELETELASDSQARLVSLTTNPDHDTPVVLKKYAQQFDADSKHWIFLTGTKTEISTLATTGLKLSAVEVEPAKRESEFDLFIHSTMFVVVDKQGNLRGVFETSGDDVDWPTAKKSILAAVRQLEREK